MASEGEQFIAEFLDYERINFKTEYKLSNLKGDEKSYRKADFYLPNYKVYIEFFGQWNQSEEANQR